jgi:methionyl-tRNA formyltransferase
MPPRIAFAGTPAFAATALEGLLAAGFEVVFALSQPDRVAGRGQSLREGAVRQLARARGIAVATPPALRARAGEAPAPATLEALAGLRAARPDVLVVAAYGLLLPQEVLDLPAGLGDAGCGEVRAINIHASLLPRWRGAAPVARAIEAGDAMTGVTIMQMDAGLDTGPMLLARAMAIGADESAGSLTGRLARLGSGLCVEALHGLAGGTLRATPQPAQGVTYAAKIGKGEAPIDWGLPAQAICARIRAFDPFPGASATAGGATLKIWRALALGPGEAQRIGTGAPGTVLALGPEGIVLACGGSTGLLVTELQRPGGRRMPAREFLQGTALAKGASWGR